MYKFKETKYQLLSTLYLCNIVYKVKLAPVLVNKEKVPKNTNRTLNVL